MSERDYWSKKTKDNWFFGALAVSTLLLVYLFSPYLTVLLFAGVVVVVSWPVYQRILRLVKGRAALAAALTTVLLAVVVFGPLSLLIYLFAVEAVEMAQLGIEFAKGDQLEEWARQVEQSLQSPRFTGYVERFVPEDFDLIGAVIGPLQSGLLAVFNTAGNLVPGLIGTTVTTTIQVVLFVFAVVSLYMEGPRLLKVVQRLSPMDDAYEDRLFGVFGQFANNLVVGSLATAFLQGLVAAVGYLIAGLEGVVFLGIVSGAFSFVPVVGTAFVWVPTAIVVTFTQGWGWGLFIVIWNAAVTGTVDNVVKPLALRGSSNIHPLLIFLAVFGGLTWMGVPGALVGPVIVAGFLALYTIYKTDYLGVEDESTVPMAPGAAPGSRARPADPGVKVSEAAALPAAPGVKASGAASAAGASEASDEATATSGSGSRGSPAATPNSSASEVAPSPAAEEAE